ncbi:MAG: hypothetical protein QOE92_1491 [Chloroflexota bacterium]|jgi:hypothetical protein|nr:hypothetical protein [Chloroflexota bacterium]
MSPVKGRAALIGVASGVGGFVVLEAVRMNLLSQVYYQSATLDPLILQQQVITTLSVLGQAARFGLGAGFLVAAGPVALRMPRRSIGFGAYLGLGWLLLADLPLSLLQIPLQPRGWPGAAWYGIQVVVHVAAIALVTVFVLRLFMARAAAEPAEELAADLQPAGRLT